MASIYYKITFKLFNSFVVKPTIFYCKCAGLVISFLKPNWFTWNKFSEPMLRTLEKKIFSILKVPYRGWYVDIGPVVGSADKIWTISMNTESKKTPLVLLHGLGAGVALWCLNLDAFASTRPVYAFDLLGFGRSSRPTFSTDSLEAERQLVDSLEEWRKEMKLEEFIFLGHSLGGFLATSYTISYPERVKHLILADPWGFPERPRDLSDMPLWVRALSTVLTPFNPLSGIRAAGPIGPWFINVIRPDITKKYAGSIDESLIPKYIYQCNSQTPSGESAYHCMMSEFGWAKNPMVKRIDQLKEDVPITLLYGSRSWVDHSATSVIKEKRYNSYFRLKVIPGAGHHVYADKPEIFNQIVLDCCRVADGEATQLAIEDKPQDEETSTKYKFTSFHSEIEKDH
ncbi:(Lyso)-N-acylphosphatidylethanolamine lipase isoform X1 [Coccinella septempunctata]|uniref:(Lyso)-N-acylphosphatidylethanolamine lipase isoform X1 n=2 Tax=Coccinella septempunctata TaxID=41139 RepID=UPI001D080350|nr:(Lyso)-N-acylphosphatidylethanolamine lipase isoform X1 [Coccinella septempunctata]